ncbi:OmpP1/FadL family transporter [Flavobacterium rhizosphaerae]|uniref:Outer membrane protein transport protein n=1 Tax=Flavobacterium rhizosphaerae TaxID=3163298 RepID=A0ABW8YXJ7_9FLAO
MKRFLFASAMLMAGVATHAQEDLNTAADAVRYSMDNITGTARFRAMGGAFGALGGDISSIMVNPAGSSIYSYNSGTVSVSSYNINNKSNYFGSRNTQNDNAFDLNQVGAAFVFNNANEDAFMNKFTLAFDYENTNSFENNIFAAGINPTNSIDNYFLHYANGFNGLGAINLSTLDNAYYEDLNFIDQQAFLGYNAYVFDPNPDPNGPAYISNNSSSGNRYQESSINTSGYNGKIAVNFSALLNDRVYVGANLNGHFTDYIKTTRFYEDDNGTGGEGVQYLQFNNERYTYGGGFSFNLGAIVKITEQFRAGLAYESPTWYKLTDEVTQSIYSNLGSFNPSMTFVLDDYTIKTPSKYTGSLAYVFGKRGLISIDYALKDYSTTEFKSNRYNSINNELSNTLDNAGELRVGTEWRINNFSLRGGYRHEQSPYKNGTTVGDLNSFSGGFGIAFGSSKLDFAYTWYQRKSDVSLLTPGLVDAARVTSTNNNVTISYTHDL